MRMKPPAVNRRNFLTSVGVAGAAGVAGALPAAKNAKAAAAPAAGAAAPSAAQRAAETEVPPHPGLAHGKPGSDFMVDVIKSLGFEYAALNPGASFRGLHESLINYGGNSAPELITCMHEESAVGIAHGYAKITGKPMLFLGHGSVGLQHASMALYNAWCDRAPVVSIVGNHYDGTKRRPGVEWVHSAQDAAAGVRDFVKWDDMPGSLQHFAESLVRATRIAMTPPLEPTLIVADAALQEEPVDEHAPPTIPKYTPTSPPQGDSGAVREAARLLANAQNPLIVADRLARTQRGIDLLVELAELLNAPVVDQRGRLNFPSMHYLNQTERRGALVAQADVILGLELFDFWGTVNRFTDNIEQTQVPLIKPGTKLISITAVDLFSKSNYQDFQRFMPVDIAMAADGEATLPALIEAVKAAIPANRRDAIAGKADALRKTRATIYQTAREAAAIAWDANPISTARMSMELWNVVKGEDFSFVSRDHYAGWIRRLWTMDKHYQFIGGPGGEGQGYFLPASIGAALANKAHGRITVSIQPDGDFMYAPGALWTAAHHKIPILMVMHNNKAYHQEVMHIQRMGNRNNRGVERALIGNAIDNPGVDYAGLAKSMGVYGEGPISDPKALGPALRRALAVVKQGVPALVDVVSQPR